MGGDRGPFLGAGHRDPAQSPTWISRRALRPYLSLCTGKASPALGTHDARLNSNLLGDALNAWRSHGARSTCKSKRSHGVRNRQLPRTPPVTALASSL